MATRLSHTLALTGRHLAPGLVLSTALVVTALSYLSAKAVAEDQATVRFDQLARAETDAVAQRIQSYLGVLRSIGGLVAALSRPPTPEEFRAQIQAIDPRAHFPGIEGIGFAEPERHGSPAASVRGRSTGRPGDRVGTSGISEPVTAVILIEPLDKENRSALGYDMYSDPIRRAAMDMAWSTGRPSASAKVDLPRGEGPVPQPGLLIYDPVFNGPTPPSTVAGRGERLIGWVFARLRADGFFRGTFVRPALGTRLVVYDGDKAGPEHELFDSGPLRSAPFRSHEARLDVAGRTWVVSFSATRAFLEPAERQLPEAVGAVGTAVALLLFFITYRETQARTRAEGNALRNAILADAGHLLATSFDYLTTLGDVVRLISGQVADGAAIYLEEGEKPVWFFAHRHRELGEAAAAELREVRLDLSHLEADARITREGTRGIVTRPRPDRPPLAERPTLAALLKRARIRTALTVPLVDRGERLGIVVLVTSRRFRPFGPDTVSLAEDLARLVISAVDSARLYRRAQEAIRVRDEFLSIASHELRTPITSLALQADSLRASALRGETETFGRKVEVLRRNVHRLASLVATMLDISRIQAGRLKLEPEDVDLAEIAREVAGRFEDEAKRGHTPISVEAPSPVTGRWDRLRLDQALTNLVSNALKYGRGQPVTLSVEQRDERGLISVTDRGIGIATDDQPRIFERFERAVSERHYSGFGLGLWIVREVVEAMGGEVRVRSAPGEGSTFTIELLRHADVVREEAQSAPGEPPQPRQR